MAPGLVSIDLTVGARVRVAEEQVLRFPASHSMIQEMRKG